ncbi:DUF2505 domain-containing protein [Mycobacterium sp. OTB74]|uniref:DUF2505 domain-containing protein n=1 Tax=Mycobacterium sp. OTB74 TaxID=1853452 RepID=UPI002474A3E8|nr:DUF2505 domain-containing protein [Mycobacterium sp. OTB74]MDH6246340.1 hypothetical protein [Mycobacterium sp. OTB74]
MPRSFDMVADYTGTVDEVHRAFFNKAYWLALMADSAASVATLDSITDDGHGGVDVATSQTMRADGLPAVATQFHRGDLSVVREEHWGPLVDGRATGTVHAHIPGAPATVSGTSLLEASDNGARMYLTASVEVRIPLVGGKIEGLIGHLVIDLIRIEQEFTNKWIADGH